ncbi:MAG: hypothetical protein IT168_23490 [Bryobacterales bacterium]|nr:hypothetical protein [Bryobacterales bacterium]
MTTASRRLAFGALLLVAGCYAVVHLRGPNGIPALLEKRQHIRTLEVENEKLRELNETQRQINKDLLHNEDKLKQEIQKRQNKIPPGSIEFRVDESAPEPDPPSN